MARWPGTGGTTSAFRNRDRARPPTWCTDCRRGACRRSTARGCRCRSTKEIRGGIVGAGMPDGAAADLPRVGRPRLAPWLPGRGDRVPAPQALAGFRVEGLDESTGAHLARPRDPDDHLALHDHGGLRHEVAFGVVADLRLPYRLPRLGLEGDEIRVQGAEDHLVFRKRDAAIVRNEAHERADVLGNPPIALPQELAGGGVDGLHPVDTPGPWRS